MTPTARGYLEHPDANEIVRRVSRFLDEEVYGAVTDQRVNYRVKVAANLLRLVERELAVQGAAVDATGHLTTPRIVDEYGGIEALAELLATGRRSVVEREVYDDLLAHVALKTDVAAIRRRPRPEQP